MVKVSRDQGPSNPLSTNNIIKIVRQLLKGHNTVVLEPVLATKFDTRTFTEKKRVPTGLVRLEIRGELAALKVKKRKKAA